MLLFKPYILLLMETNNPTITTWFLRTGSIEGYSYLVLLFVAMPLKYWFAMPQYIRSVGMLHGVLFVLFATLLTMMVVFAKLPLKKAAIALVLSFIPFGTFYLKRVIK